MKSAETKRTSKLIQKVNRWEGHMGDKGDSIRKLPSTLGELVGSSNTEKSPKRRKTLNTKPEDDSTTKACIAIANLHSLHSNVAAVKLPSKSTNSPHSVGNRAGQTIAIHTNIHPMTQLHAGLPENDAITGESSNGDPKTISGESFGIIQLSNIFDASQRHWNRRTSRQIEEGMVGIRKEEVSRSHIRKVLWVHTPSRPFSACIMAQQSYCRAQLEPALNHPLAPEAACMAYYSVRQYEALLEGVNINETGPQKELCEFCYRYYVECDVERIKHGSHRSEEEVPFRYYKAGTVGEYSVSGMHQPVEKKSTQYPDGILGHMRKFNVSDFVPVVARLAGIEPGETWHVDEFRKKLEAGELPSDEQYLYGWEETKPLHQLNERAFLEVNQIDPYERVSIDTGEELTVACTLRDYFERRATHPEQNYVHIFQDLMECVNDPEYISLPHSCKDSLVLDPQTHRILSEKQCWLRWCLHNTTQPLDPALHSIYYTLLVKINTCKELAYFNRPIQVTDHIKQKLRKYLSSHFDLISWMHTNNTLSDKAIRSATVIDPVLGTEVPVLFAYYPRNNHHYRIQDFELAQLYKTVRRRDDPTAVCARRYVLEQEHRLEHQLIEVPHEFQPPPKTHGSSLQPSFITEMKRQFDENVAAFHNFEHDFVWNHPDIASFRRAVLDDADEDFDTRSVDAVQKQAYDRALLVIESNFAVVKWTADCTSQEYAELVQNYTPFVFCDFKSTVWWLLEHPALHTVIEFAHQFISLMPDGGARLDITSTTVNGVPWEKHCYLAACLLRSYVAERLHTLEPSHLSNERYNLVLFRNSHLALFRKITENTDELMTDVQLNSRRGSQTVNTIEHFYPYPQREIHQGLLPDYVDSLTKVNFISEGGMDEYAWIKMQFKKPDRCCDGREFHEMLRTLCMQNPTFYRYTCLELELSFKGLYKHCKVVPSFARTVLLDEIFDHAEDDETVRNMIFRMIVDNQTLIAEATSESLCCMLEYAAPLRDVLKEVYRDWFAWRVKANMDMARKCFDDDGDFSRVTEIVYDRVKLHSNKTIYRHSESNFIVWLCNHIKKFDEQRYKTRSKRPSQASRKLNAQPTKPVPVDPVFPQPDELLSYQERLVVDSMVYYLNPTQSIDATDLEIVGMDKRTIDVLYELYEIFRYNISKSTGRIDRDIVIPSNTVGELLTRVARKQYNIASFFFQALQRYQTIRITRINNFNILEKQRDSLLQKYGHNTLAELPENTTKVVISNCCLNVKTTFTRRPDQFAVGCEDVYYSALDGTYTCAKKELRTGKRKNPADTTAPKRLRSALKLEQELKKPVCNETEVLVIDALEGLIETDGCKIPHSKKNNANAEKGNNIAPPISPYWITPCCGTLFGYRYDNWYPGGYACGTCSASTKLAETFDSIFCVGCKIPVKKDMYVIVKTYDDMFTHRYTSEVLCTRCTKNWRFWDIAEIPLSTIVKGSANIELVENISRRDDFVH